MGNQNIYRRVGLIVLVVLFLLVVSLAFITHENSDLSVKSSFLQFTIVHHTWIMVALVVISLLVGFFLSHTLYSEVKKKQKASKSILDTVYLFLNEEEKRIVAFLVEKEGRATQAEISRLPNLNKVKAHRSLQKLKEKRIVDVESFGKVRKVTLKDNILDILKG